MRRFGLISAAIHLLAFVLFLLAGRRFAEAPPPPPPAYATVELIQQDTPSVGEGGSSQPSKGENQPQQPAPPPAPPPQPKAADAAAEAAPPEQEKAEHPSEDAAPTKTTAETPAPPEPAPEAVPAPPPPPAPAAENQPAKAPPPVPPSPPQPEQRKPESPPEIRLGDDEAAGTGLVSGDHVIPAAPDSNVQNKPPPYPKDAVRRREQGTVLVEIHVDPQGRPANIEIVESSGYPSLDLAAMDAVRKWHFHPAIENGEAIPSVLPFRVTFSLTEN